MENNTIPQSLNRENFFSSLDEFSFLAPRNTKRGLESYVFERSDRQRNLYFGTGLSTTKALTRGLPYDFIAMLVGAEISRRACGIGKIIHEISDTHAVDNNFGSQKEISALAREQVGLISRMVENLGIGDIYECTLASEYHKDPIYIQLLERVKAASPDEGHYFHYQWAGMAYLASQKDVRLKVGWLAEDDLEAKFFDERRFDLGYDKLGIFPLNYTYIYSGRNFAPGRPRVSPYTSVEGEERIMLKPGEDANVGFDKWVLSRPITKDARKTILYLANITTLFETLFVGNSRAENLYSQEPENPSKGLIGISDQRLHKRMAAQSINVVCLAEKINGILENVFELRSPRLELVSNVEPRRPVPPLSDALRHVRTVSIDEPKQ